MSFSVQCFDNLAGGCTVTSRRLWCLWPIDFKRSFPFWQQKYSGIPGSQISRDFI